MIRAVLVLSLGPWAAVPSTEDAPPAAVYSDVLPPAAPKAPAPWVKSPFIMGMQVVGGMGMRAAAQPLMFVPVMGPLLLAGLEAAGVTWTGDRLGDGRAPLLWPLMASLAVSGLGGLFLHLGLALAAADAFFGFYLVGFSQQAPQEQRPWVVALLGVYLLGSGASSLALLASSVLTAASPFAATAVYQWTKRLKEEDDRGDGWVRFLP